LAVRANYRDARAWIYEQMHFTIVVTKGTAGDCRQSVLEG